MRRYLAGCLVGLGLAFASPSASALVIEAEDAPIHTAGDRQETVWNLHSTGEVGAHLTVPQDATYTVVVRAAGTPCRGVWPRMAVYVNHEPAGKAVSVAAKEHAEHTFRVHLPAGAHAVTVAFLNDAYEGPGQDRNLLVDRFAVRAPDGAKPPTMASAEEVAAEAEKRAQEALKRAALGAERHRKSGATVTVLRGGKPVADASVTAEQTGHAFLFGCNIFGFDRLKTDEANAAYKQRFADLFNYATLGFYWRSYEPQRGKPRYDYTDTVVAWCQEHGIRMKGHPLLWAHRAGVPTWSDGQPAPDLQKARVQEIVRRYHGKIDFWEVVNEASHLHGVPIAGPYRWAQEADPTAHLILNDYRVFTDGNPAFYQMLEKAMADGVPFQGVGIQAHEPRTTWFPADRVQQVLDQYARLGKAIHITEFEPQSGGKPIAGARQGTWDEAAQAEFAERFYRICFGHPAVVAITWWDLCDAASWLPGGGLVRKDLSPKPVYERLKRMIHGEWTTRAAGPTDRTGTFRLRGFHGTYRVTVEADGKTATTDATLEKGKANAWTVRVE